MQEYFYKLEKTYPVSMADMNLNYSVKPAALLNFLQDCASRNIKNPPFGNVELNNQGLGWFLVRYRIIFDEYPSNIDEIIIFTENRGTIRQTAYRDFEAYTTDKKRLLRGTTSWLMVDLKNKSLVNIEQKFPNITTFEKRDNDIQLQKLKPLTLWEQEKKFHVRYEDLDMNGHVNNTVYLAWAMEALGYDFLTSHRMKTLDIYYKHEVRYGEDVLSCAKLDDNISEHLIKNANTGEEVCLIRVMWGK